MTSSAMLFVILAAAPQTPNAPPIRQVSSVEVRVTDRSGAPLKSARVAVEGISQRAGTTPATGRMTFLSVRVGHYVLRVERDGFIPLEKEFTVVAGRPALVGAALSPAVIPAPVVTRPVGNTRVLSIPDFLEKQLIGKEMVKESALGCSGATEARLIQMRELLTAHAHRDADEMLYVVAGEATLKIGESEQRVSAGWFSMVPRGTPHSLSRKGRNPVILLSLLSGQPCTQTLALASAGR